MIIDKNDRYGKMYLFWSVFDQSILNLPERKVRKWIYINCRFLQMLQNVKVFGSIEKMHLSQSTVSTHVSALENELGKKLIRRTARNFELTEDGVKLYKYAIDILLLHRKAIMEVGGMEVSFFGLVHLLFRHSGLFLQY